MKVLLDTTYLLPLIGVTIKEVSKDVLLKLITKGHEISISEITLFELSAKGAKYIQDNLLLPERITLGIRSLLYNDGINKIPSYDNQMLLTAFSLRSLMNDFIDCLILSTALNCSDALVTEDQVIHSLKTNKRYVEIKSQINAKFEILAVKEIQKL